MVRRMDLSHNRNLPLTAAVLILIEEGEVDLARAVWGQYVKEIDWSGLVNFDDIWGALELLEVEDIKDPRFNVEKCSVCRKEAKCFLHKCVRCIPKGD